MQHLPVFAAMIGANLFLEINFLLIRTCYVDLFAVFEYRGVAPRQYFEGAFQLLLMIELGRLPLPEQFEVCGINEVAHRNSVDVELLLFDGITHLIGIWEAIGPRGQGVVRGLAQPSRYLLAC